jgi:hypothetical protein
MMEECYRICAPEDAIDDILNYPDFHLAIMVANVRPQYRNLPDWKLRSVLMYYAIQNTMHRHAISGFVTRLCFYTGDKPPTFLSKGLGGEEAIEFVRLTRENLYEVLHATTCVPFVQVSCCVVHATMSCSIFVY